MGHLFTRRITVTSAVGRNVTALAPGLAQGEIVGYTFKPTFVGTSDNTQYRAADITAGFSTGSWGTEYLAFHVGGSNSAGSLLTTEQMRLTTDGYASPRVGIKFSDGTTQTTAPVIVSSAEIVMSNGNVAYSFPHGLGVKPRFSWASIRCVTANNGYAVNDVVIITSGCWSSTRLWTTSCSATTSNISIWGALALPLKDGSGVFTLSAVQWRLTLHAMK